ncbi:HK97 family phage prohead protease [Methylococcus capsulatus]|uniref:HK97 family phage prohead protease n=1 Tax=Methylococcus capsulatus TaxID=414 RepID=UPI001C52D6C0|nr:HK97 family phage prohead protease [Methylococcus capsulatus]QXP94363.1 HK97 family phage prohead protease [Methylococcus capsulatus]
MKALPMQFRSATIAPDTTDSSKRTFDVVWSTGAAVNRYDLLENRYFNEVLDLSGADLSRLNSGAAPVLDGHQAAGVGSVIGVVERASVSAGKGTARIRLSERPFVDPILRDVKDGILRNVSIGYSINEATLIPGKNGQPDTLRVTRFTPMEISLVAIPADAGAQVQRAQTKTFPVQLTRQLFDTAAIYTKRNATRGIRSTPETIPPRESKPTPPVRRALPNAADLYSKRRASI